MSKTAGTSNNGGLNERSTRTRTPSSRKCCACQCQAGSQETSRGGRKRTTVKPVKGISKPKKIGPDVLPSVARAKSSVQLRPDSLKNKPRKVAAVPTNTSPTVKTASPRQIWRKKVDSTPGINKASSSSSKLKKPEVPKQVPVKEEEDQEYDQSSENEDSGYEYHITCDGFDEPEYLIGHVCGFCEADLAVAKDEDINQTEFSTLPVVAMLSCGHAFHVHCVDQAELVYDHGEPICVFCESTML